MLLLLPRGQELKDHGVLQEPGPAGTCAGNCTTAGVYSPV